MNAQEHRVGDRVSAKKGDLIGTIKEIGGDGVYGVKWPGYEFPEWIPQDRIRKTPQGRRDRAPTKTYSPVWNEKRNVNRCQKKDEAGR